MSLIRVTEECKVGGLGDRFLSMFRAEHLTATYVSAEKVKKASLVSAEIRTRRLDIAKPTRYL